MPAERPMRVVRHLGPGSWPEMRAAGSLTLAHADRHLRRKRLTTDAGPPVLIDLPAPVQLRDGDGLATEDGVWLVVRAAEEDLLEAAAADAAALARLAWHLGNRHTPAEIGPGRVRVAYDHVLEDMLRGLGTEPRRVRAAFEPEFGAYAALHAHHERV
jgi:urease accessory protein